MNVPLIIGVDPGTVWNGVAVNRPQGVYHGQVILPDRRFHDAKASYDEFKVIIEYSAPYQIILNESKSLGIYNSNKIVSGIAYIERPSRKVAKLKQLNNTTSEQFQTLENVTKYWKRLLCELSPYMLVEFIDSTTWQKKLARGLTKAKSDEKFREIASRLAGHRVVSPHSTDALCLVKLGLDYHASETSAS